MNQEEFLKIKEMDELRNATLQQLKSYMRGQEKAIRDAHNDAMFQARYDVDYNRPCNYFQIYEHYTNNANEDEFYNKGYNDSYNEQWIFVYKEYYFVFKFDTETTRF